MNLRLLPSAFAGVALILGCLPLSANLLTNGSFENTGGTFVPDGNKTDDLPSGSTVIPGWTTINGTRTAWIENGNPWNIPASDGMFFLDLTSYADSVTFGGVSQSFATTPGTSYVLTFDIGYGGNSGAFSGPVKITAAAAGSSQTFTSGSGDPNPAVWNHETLNFTASSTTTLLTLTGISGIEYIGLDNADVEVAAVGTVPEPNMIYLIAGFLAAIAIVRLRLRPSAW